MGRHQNPNGALPVSVFSAFPECWREQFLHPSLPRGLTQLLFSRSILDASAAFPPFSLRVDGGGPHSAVRAMAWQRCARHVSDAARRCLGSDVFIDTATEQAAMNYSGARKAPCRKLTLPGVLNSTASI